VKDEDAPLDPDPPAELKAMLDAIRYLEHAVTTPKGSKAWRYAMARFTGLEPEC
jgi:hypothetical protein